MSTLHTLSEAFAELERQADELSDYRAVEPAELRPSRTRPYLLPVAAGVAAVLTVAGGAAYLASGHRHSPTAATPGDTPAAATGHRAVASRPSTPSAPHSAASAGPGLPQTSQELADRFRTVLAGSGIPGASFTVTESTDYGAAVRMPAPPKHLRGNLRPSAGPAHVQATVPPPAPPIPAGQSDTNSDKNGAAINGTLTAAGSSGGFDLQIFRAGAAGAHLTASCSDLDRVRCAVSRLGGGGSLAVGTEHLQSAANAVTYQVALIRPDGVEFLMHVSNEQDPKGAGPVLAAQPPLTTDQMTALVTSDRW